MTCVPSASRYANSSLYRRCGGSGLLLPRVSLGLWHNFGAQDDFANSRALVLRAFDLGITHFDLANNYGPPPGSAESTLARILCRDLAAHRDEIILSTKAGYRMWDGPYGEGGSRKYLLSSLDRSLERLGIPCVDIFYSHRFDPVTPLEETMGALADAVRSGRALYVGLSNYDAEQTARAVRILQQLGVRCLIHQPQYNLLQRQFEQGVAAQLLEHRIGGIAFCPLAQGLLTSRYLAGIPPDARAARDPRFLRREDITADKLDRIRKLDAIARRRGQTLAQMSLAWVLRHPAITSALIGASRVSQIEENIAALERPAFFDEELAAIEACCPPDTPAPAGSPPP